MKSQKMSPWGVFKSSLAMISPAMLVFCLAFSPAVSAKDNALLAAIYQKDQAGRAAMQNGGPVVDFRDDLARREQVFDLLVDGQIRTGQDYIRAVIILQHTNLWKYTPDLTLSMSPENFILSFKMARKAYEKGQQKLGVHFLVWAFNYYALGVGCDPDKYGFDVHDNRIVPRDADVTSEQRYNACRYFDPVATYKSLGLIDEPNSMAD